MPGGQKPSPGLRKALEKIANQKRQTLDALPPDPAGQIKALSDYDFMDSEARERFQELMKMLQQQMLGTSSRHEADDAEPQARGPGPDARDWSTT